MRSRVNFTWKTSCSLENMEDMDLDALARDLGFDLKSEQNEAVCLLLRGRDVFGVLPTGFGKSLIYQLFVLVKNSGSPNAASLVPVERPTIIVICPLKSIIEEQITANDFNLSAAELKFHGETLNAVQNSNIQVVYVAARQVLTEKFTLMLKEEAESHEQFSVLLNDALTFCSSRRRLDTNCTAVKIVRAINIS